MLMMDVEGDTREEYEKNGGGAMDVDGRSAVGPAAKDKPQKLKRGQRTTKQKKKKMKAQERALAVAARTTTKLKKGGTKEARKKSAKSLYT